MKNKLNINLEVSLVEIIFSILIFAIAGAIMLNSFIIARFTQIKTNDKVEALSIVQSQAEMIKYFKSTDEMFEYLSGSFNYNETSENKNIFVNYYDKDWNLCNKKDNEFTVTVQISDIPFIYGEIKEINIISKKTKEYPIIDKNKEDEENIIFKINTKKFFPNNEGRW